MPNQVTICSVGDLMICDSPLYASVGIGSKYHQLKGKFFSSCKDAFKKADIVVGNFETVVHKPRNGSLEEIQMCCSEDAIKELHDAGFNVLNLANNHCLQHGTEGFLKTKEICEKNGIQPIGIRDEKAYEIHANDICLVFFSLCIHLEWYQPDKILYEDRIEKILHDIKEAKGKKPKAVIIVSVHWGDEFATYPSNAQIALGHTLVDSGANIILGHHPHVFQGIEEYKGGIIAYSQGNFISDMIPEKCRQTGIIMIKIDSDDITTLSYQVIQMWIDNDYLPIIKNGEWLTQRQEYLGKAVAGEFSDEQYWQAVSSDHVKAHNAFMHFFKTHITKYHFLVFFQMVWGVIGRKLKRMIGTSNDGRISSMDPRIWKAIEKEYTEN